MTEPELREKVVALINEAVKSGARLSIACEEAEINKRTYTRWITSFNQINEHVDKRTIAVHPTPHNKLTPQEKQEIINLVNVPEFSSLPPSQIVPILADRGFYIASESSFYRVLKEVKSQHHRGRSKEPIKRTVTTHVATAPNQVYTWDYSDKKVIPTFSNKLNSIRMFLQNIGITFDVTLNHITF